MDKLVDALVDRLLPTERIQRKYGEEEIKKRQRNSIRWEGKERSIASTDRKNYGLS